MHSLDAFCTWLSHTAASRSIRGADWLIPALQTVHILAVSAVIAAALMVSLRLLGMGTEPAHGVVKRYLPVIWTALPVLLLTGATLIAAEPARALENPVFGLKMALLAAALALTGLCRATLARQSALPGSGGQTRRLGKLLGALTLLTWVGIIFAGRWIAYVQPG